LSSAEKEPAQDINWSALEFGELWRSYKEENSQTAKDKLLAEYSPLVKYTAQRMAVNLPSSVELGDLMGDGVMGLIKAVESFDPALGYKFGTFASHKVRGAILDGLRSSDWVPRSIRQKSRNLQQTYSSLEQKLGRIPYDDEVAAELGLTMSEFESLLSQVAPTTIISLEEQLPDRGGDSKTLTVLDTIEDPQGANPLKELGYQETKRILKDTIAELPEKEKLVVALYHYEELTLKEIGSILGITESRVSQIHSKAMLKLRGRVTQKANS
jgi:RNA polymerase sigma factor for flagellar operon FliA